MQLSDFNYDLPAELIAQHPLAERSASRLLELAQTDDGKLRCLDRSFNDIVQLIGKQDLLVFNDTRVIPARLFGQKETGGHVELLIERITGPNQALAQLRASKVPKPGGQIILRSRLNTAQSNDAPITVTVLGRAGLGGSHDFYEITFSENAMSVVGAGTFTPVRNEDLALHQMHHEWYSIPQKTLQAIQETKERGGKIIAVGTTSIRSLESYAITHQLEGETNLFITPGFQFQLVDALITNFHLPKSTLLMLVSAFSGVEQIRHAYQHAIQERYRFFSYGDAMFLRRT